MPLSRYPTFRGVSTSAVALLFTGSMLAGSSLLAAHATERNIVDIQDRPSLLQLARNDLIQQKQSYGTVKRPSVSLVKRLAQRVDAVSRLDLRRFRHNSFPAYQHALANKKYTVILFATELCVFCKNLAKLLRDKRLAKYADRIVVSITDSRFDEGARQLEEALGVVRFPTLVVLKTNSKNIHVAGRIEGEVPVKEIDRVFSIATRKPIAK